MNEAFKPVTPWPMPALADCSFYTCMDFGDETVEDVYWDIRGRFDAYIGNYPIAGKSVLDVGTASGFLAFAAEAAGATVTAVDALHASEFHRIPFRGTMFSDDRQTWITDTEKYLNTLKNSFWYGWHKLNSKAEVVYAPIQDFWKWERKFDVVVAGAIVEHMSDPVSFLGAISGLANEAVIIAFTPVTPTEELLLKPMNGWDNAAFNYSWFELSFGMYKQIFANLGFSVEIVTSQAIANYITPPQLVDRPTLIARRLPQG